MKKHNSLQDTAKFDKFIDERLHSVIKNKNVKISEDINFITYAHNNLWSDRRSRGMPWRMDVFQFIIETYSPWLGNGIVQSDIKKVDPGLYAELHKRLTAIRREGKDTPEWIEKRLPKEYSDRGLAASFPNDAERERVKAHREFERERVAASKVKRGLTRSPSP